MLKQIGNITPTLPCFVENVLLLFLFFSPVTVAAQLFPGSVQTSHGKIGFYEFRPQGYNPDTSYRYPLIIFLHGVGERGNGTTDLPLVFAHALPKLLQHGATMKFVVNGQPHAFVVLMPQMTKDYINWQNFYIDEMMEYARKNLNIDTNKIFLTGWSLGGGGAWKYATFSETNANRVAGILLAAASPDYTELCNLAKGKVAVWAYHALDDASVPIHFTRDAIDGINACLPRIPAQRSFYPVGGHPFIALAAYDTINEYQYPNMFQWMAGTTRANIQAKNLAPVAQAGNDTLIVLPVLETILNGAGSYDPNDVIVKYQWSLLRGPSSPGLKIDKPGFPVTRVSGLEPGTYVFRISITDQFGLNRSDTVQVVVKLPARGVNAPPALQQMADVRTLTESCHLSCTARDFDGQVKKITWRQVSGPDQVQVFSYGNSADLFGLATPGTYRMEVTAFDNSVPAGKAVDTICITKIKKATYIPVYFQNGRRLAGHNLPSSVYLLGMFMVMIVAPIVYFSHTRVRVFGLCNS